MTETKPDISSNAQPPNEQDRSPSPPPSLPPIATTTNTPKTEAQEQTVETQPSVEEVQAESSDVAATATTTAPGATETALKGKDKEEPPPAPTLEKLSSREEDSISIGPTSDLPSPALNTASTSTESSSASAPVCSITLLLPTGARHPYKLDEKYLTKRGVDIPDVVAESGKKDPFSISVYKLKELILREWREEWDGKPASPSSIRLIHFGKLLDDKEQLKKYQLSKEGPNVVHMSVRPAEMMEEDEGAKGGKASSREGRSREGGGGCCVIL
ncbi:ubiquitin-related domain-containing protein [Podospora australis]|uniref:Ubiquitin-related domain-containing protein n=1 Tax=Podospora australis TaxID=1536484 RepID=A0AAN7AGM5_9PEZI|nr:ubiquitin-related domain-containing protein [Podospora australis]